jgi:type I restriction enzyme S subunit
MKQGWEIQRFEDCFKLKSGDGLTSKNMSEDGTYPVFGGNGVAGLHNDFNLSGSNVIIGRVGALCGNVRHMIEKIWLTDNAFKIVDYKYDFDHSFLTYLLNFKNLREYARQAAQPVISNSSLKDVVLEFPKSLTEQQRIVAILDEAFAAIAKAKANAKQNLKNAKVLFESYLRGVFENKGEGWVNATIGETCNLQTGGTPSTSKKEFYEGGTIKWLVSGDINQKVINDCEGRITELGMNSSNTKYLPINSVLIALNGQGKTRGTVAMLRTKATCNQSLVSIFPKDEKSLLPELVFSNLEGRYDEIRKMTGDSGNDRRGLNMPLIRSIKFSYPKKINEQKEIIKKLDDLRSVTKKLEAIYQQKINDLEELKKSILQKAFNGELKTKKIEFYV